MGGRLIWPPVFCVQTGDADRILRWSREKCLCDGRLTAISDYMINEQIRDREVRLIGENGEQLGIMPARDALQRAREAELDLVKIAPNAKPPVCKIIDYSKYRYEMLRKEKEARKKQKSVEVKEIRMSPNIDDNDLNTKSSRRATRSRSRCASGAVRWLTWRRQSTFWMISQRSFPTSRSLRNRPRSREGPLSFS